MCKEDGLGAKERNLKKCTVGQTILRTLLGFLVIKSGRKKSATGTVKCFRSTGKKIFY